MCGSTRANDGKWHSSEERLSKWKIAESENSLQAGRYDIHASYMIPLVPVAAILHY